MWNVRCGMWDVGYGCEMCWVFVVLDQQSGNYLFIYLFTKFAKDNLAGEISQNYCSNNETPKHAKKDKQTNKKTQKNKEHDLLCRHFWEFMEMQDRTQLKLEPSWEVLPGYQELPVKLRMHSWLESLVCQWASESRSFRHASAIRNECSKNEIEIFPEKF